MWRKFAKRPPPAFKVNSTSCILIASIFWGHAPILEPLPASPHFLSTVPMCSGGQCHCSATTTKKHECFRWTVSMLLVVCSVSSQKPSQRYSTASLAKPELCHSTQQLSLVSWAVKALRGTPTPASILHFSSRGSTTPPHPERYRILQISLARNKELD